tara:strand:- start:1196 stop:1477 length:282 start_codon:yes stop_codon:yes gene_type:complete
MWARLSTKIYIRYNTFFRIRLLTSDSTQIAEHIDQLEKESKIIRDEALRLTWFMRGGLSYTEALNLSFHDRQSVSEIVKENLETAKKTGMPFF